MTPPELIVWQALRKRRLEGWHFRRQHPIGPYVLDFHCARAGLAVEIDGQRRAEDARQARDIARDRWLEERGVIVYRLLAGDVLADLDGAIGGVFARLQAIAEERPLHRAG